MSTVTDGIERTSREIGRRLAPGDMYDGSTPAGWLEVQIVFWSEKLEDKRRLHKDHLLQILRTECAIGTDLLQVTDVYHGTQPGDAGRRDRLKDRLLDLDRERRQAAVLLERDVAQIQEKLLHLLGQHAHLRGPERPARVPEYRYRKNLSMC